MFAVLGPTGNVGAATVRTLREKGAPVRAIIRNPDKSEPLRTAGCEIAVADLQDTPALIDALAGVDTIQVILPLRPQVDDPAGDLRRSMASVIEALSKVGPKRFLAISDYGAHVDHDIGMPSVFHEFEKQLSQLHGHRVILRSAEYMHNWGRGIPAAITSGVLPSFQIPVEMVQPTIAAQDLGRIAASLLLRPDNGSAFEVIHAEGPLRYSAGDVAKAVSELSGKPVMARAVPRSEWSNAFAKMPPSLADLLTKANDAKNAGGLVEVEHNGVVLRGPTELKDALQTLMR